MGKPTLRGHWKHWASAPVLSGEPLNWQGTYEHAAQTLIKQLTWERAWRN